MSKNILLFMDGTKHKPSDRCQLEDTNVWKLYEAPSISQLGLETHAKYLRGVGTEREKNVDAPADDLRLFRIRQWNPPARAAKRVGLLAHRFSKRMLLKYPASAVGWGVADSIREAYAFICRHYGTRIASPYLSNRAACVQLAASSLTCVGESTRPTRMRANASIVFMKSMEFPFKNCPRTSHSKGF